MTCIPRPDVRIVGFETQGMQYLKISQIVPQLIEQTKIKICDSSSWMYEESNRSSLL